MRRKAPLFSLIGVFFLVSLLEIGAAETNENVARLWLARAVEFIRAGEWGEAKAAWETSVEFAAPGSDSRYLSALFRLSDTPPDVTGAVEEIETAFDTANWDLIEPVTAAVVYADLTLRLKKYDRLLTRYRQWPRGIRADESLTYRAARAAFFLGLREEASALSLGILASRPDDAAARALAAASGDAGILDTLPLAIRRYGPAVVASLEPYLLTDDLPESVREYYLEQPHDPGLARALEVLDGQRGAADLDALWSSRRYSRDGDLLRRLRENGDMEVSNAVDVHIAAFTGSLETDANRDGYPEDTVDFIAGSPTFRRIDGNQDGIVEWTVAYGAGGLPESVILEEGSLRTSTTFERGGYPLVLGLTQAGPHLTMVFSLEPGVWSWDPFGLGEKSGAPEETALWDSPVVPPETDSEFPPGTHRIYATATADHDGVEATWEFVVFDDFPLRSREVRRRHTDDGAVIELGVRELLFEEGVTVAGRRSFTPGNWELYERYERGVLVGVAWDPGTTGTPTYRHDWAVERVLEIEAWDLDRDGWMDIRFFRYPDGRVDAARLMVTEADEADLFPWDAADWPPWEY